MKSRFVMLRNTVMTEIFSKVATTEAKTGVQMNAIFTTQKTAATWIPGGRTLAYLYYELILMTDRKLFSQRKALKMRGLKDDELDDT